MNIAHTINEEIKNLDAELEKLALHRREKAKDKEVTISIDNYQRILKTQRDLLKIFEDIYEKHGKQRRGN